MISLETRLDASPEALAQQFSVSYDEATHQTSLSVATSTHEAQDFLVLMVTTTLRLIQKIFCQGAVLKEDGDLDCSYQMTWYFIRGSAFFGNSSTYFLKTETLFSR